MVNKPTEAAVTTPKYAYEELKKNCNILFGISTSAFVGATYRLDKTTKYSIPEMQAFIREWMATKTTTKKKEDKK